MKNGFMNVNVSRANASAAVSSSGWMLPPKRRAFG
jgi:hypothetical protein